MIKKLLAIGVFNILMAAIFVVGLLSGVRWVSDQHLKTTQQLTGYDVLSELNKYREKVGLPDFILDDSLCNNIGERWQHYKDYNNHDGIQEFADKWQQGKEISEILAPGATAQETVNNWTQSPSHDIIIKERSKICVYSHDNLSVALLSN